jgi:hypothetical protein
VVFLYFASFPVGGDCELPGESVGVGCEEEDGFEEWAAVE